MSHDARRRVLTAYRYHAAKSQGMSPAAAMDVLVTEARRLDLTDRASTPPGGALEAWATTGKPPRWAAYAAALWLQQHATVTDPDERQALALVLAELPSASPDPHRQARVFRGLLIEIADFLDQWAPIWPTAALRDRIRKTLRDHPPT